MPKFVVGVRTGIPQDGHVLVEAQSEESGKKVIEQAIADLELTGNDERILYDDEFGDIVIVSIRPATEFEAEEEADFCEFAAEEEEETDGERS